MPPAKSDTGYFPRHLILAGALICGMLLALAIHILGQSVGLSLAALWSDDPTITAALAWWLIAVGAFAGGYATALLMNGAVSGQMPRSMRQFLILILVVVLAAAGQAASAPGSAPSALGVVAGLAALLLGSLMAFCGAFFALRRA